MGMQNVSKIDILVKLSLAFKKDVVHFTENAGKLYVNTLLYNAEVFFKAELIELENEMEINEVEEEKNVDETMANNISKMKPTQNREQNSND
jgi:hypothetical protein